MKKILAAALLCTVSAFAGWDKFPVIEYGKGEAKFVWEAARQGNGGSSGGYFYGIRYSPLEKLELAAYPGYTLGARYQVMPVLSAGIDIGLPLPGTAWSFTPNAQFSMPLTSALTLGSNVELTLYTEDANEYSQGTDFEVGVELDLILGEKSTVWFGFDIRKRLTESERNNRKLGDDEGFVVSPSLGYLINLGNLELGTYIGFRFGEDAGIDPYVTFVGIEAAVRF